MDGRGSAADEDSRSATWTSPTQPVTTSVLKFQSCLESLLESEATLWRSPDIRLAGTAEVSRPSPSCAWMSNYQEGQAILSHGRLVGHIHDYYRNLEKNRCCLTLAARRNAFNSVRIVQQHGPDPMLVSLPQPRQSASARSRKTHRGSEIVLAGDNLTLYQSALLSAFLPVLAAPGPPSPFTPGVLTTPTDAMGAGGFSFGGSATAGDKEVPALRMSAAASALANLEKDCGSTGDLSSLVTTRENQFDRLGPKKASSDPPALDSVTTEMLRELSRVTFQQTEQQQMCTEQDLRDAVGRRSYSEVLARHLMARLGILDNNSHPFYRPTAFLCPQAYDEWVQGEKQHIKQLLSRFWHHPLPQPAKVSSSSSASNLAARLLRSDHHAAYVQLLERVVHQQEVVRGRSGVPLLPTAHRLLKEFALRFGVGELFRRIAYLRLLSHKMEHNVWFTRHVCVSLLAVLELLPVKPSQRTAAVKCELERLHEAVATLHSHVDHALTRIHILFPNNQPPDGILSMVQLLSLVLFTQRYLTNQQGQAVSHWLQRYLADAFEWRYEYHKTVLSAELEITSAAYPLTPALMNGLIVEMRSEVACLDEHYESAFKRYFSVSQLGRQSYYQQLMRDVQEVCHYKLPVEQLDLDMLGLMFRLAELDSMWFAGMSVQEQVWREPFFRLVLTWLQVLHKHAIRWLMTACINDTWSTLVVPAVDMLQSRMQTSGTAILPADGSAVASTPVGQADLTASRWSSGLYSNLSQSAFNRVKSASAVALAGSFQEQIEPSSSSVEPVVLDTRPHSNTFSSLASASFEGSSRRHSLLQQSVISHELPSFDRLPSLSMSVKLSHTPVLSFMCSRSPQSFSPITVNDSSLTMSRRSTQGSEARSSATPSSLDSSLLFRGDNLVPARPAVLRAPALTVHSSRKSLLKPGPVAPGNGLQYMPSPVQPINKSHADSRSVVSHSASTIVAGDGSRGTAVGPVTSFGSLPLAQQRPKSKPSDGRDGLPVRKDRTAEWVASMSQPADGTAARPALVGHASAFSAYADSAAIHRPESQPRSLSRATDAATTRMSRTDSAAADLPRKISLQSNTSTLRTRTSVGESSAFSPHLTSFSESGVGCGALPLGLDRALPVSSSLIDLVVVMSRMTNAMAMLTDVVTPSPSTFGLASTTPPAAVSASRAPSRSISVVSASSSGSGGLSDVQWGKGMDVVYTMGSMHTHVFNSCLDVLSECATLYADNMLCADLCGTPEGVARQLVGEALVNHIKERHQSGLLWGCRHYHVTERCNDSRPSTPETPVHGRGNAVRCSSNCMAASDPAGIEPVAAEMCTRVNNLASLLCTYPLLQAYMLAQVRDKWQLPGRDSGLPFSPSLNLDSGDVEATEKRCSEVCSHIGQILDGMIYIIAHRLNQVAAPCLHELLSLRLPVSYTLSEHLQPVDDYLRRHMFKLKAALYKDCFQSLLLVMWRMTVQNIHKILNQWLAAGKKVRLENKVCFLLRVVGHFMEFFHWCGLDLELVSSTSNRLVHLLNIYALPTASLAQLHRRLHAQHPAASGSLPSSVGLSPDLIHSLRSDLHALKKCFSGRQLTDWLAAHSGKFGLTTSQSHQRVAQNLLSTGIIQIVESPDEGIGVTAPPVFLDGHANLYRFTATEDCRADTPAGKLLCSLEIGALDASWADDSGPAGGGDSPLPSSAVDNILSVLRNRSLYDQSAKDYLSRTGVRPSA